jgi:hypothetical protein
MVIKLGDVQEILTFEIQEAEGKEKMTKMS